MACEHLFNLIFFFCLECKSNDVLCFIHIERWWTLTTNTRCKHSLTVVDEQVALQGEGGAEQSFALLALEGSFLGVGLREEQGICKQSCLARDNDEDDGRRSCFFAWLTCCGKAAQRGLKVQSASVILPFPLPWQPCQTCSSEWHLNPQSKHGDLRGGAGHRPHRSQPPRRLIDHTPPASVYWRCSTLTAADQDWHFVKDAHLLVILVDIAVGELLPAQLTFIRFVFAVNDLMSCYLVQTLEGAIADLTGIRSLLYSVARDTAEAVGTIKIQHNWRSISLPECVIMWRFSWFVEMNFLSHEWHSNISCTWNKHEIYKRSRKHENWAPWCAFILPDWFVYSSWECGSNNSTAHRLTATIAYAAASSSCHSCCWCKSFFSLWW